MRLSARLVLAVLGLALPLTSLAAPALQPVQPGQTLSNRYLDVRVPQDKGWQIAGSSPMIVSFVKQGTGEVETYLAQVTLFPLGRTRGKAAFMQYIRAGIEKDTPADLFHPVHSKLTYTQERGYACARYSGLTEDHSKPDQGNLLLQVESLYCQHPADGRIGFVVAFMHRGKHADKTLEHQAESFIQGVRIHSSSRH